MITIENWEEYAILRADGELDTDGVAALEGFLAAHPELVEEAKMFDRLRLVPDEAIVFAGKESLLKHEASGEAKPGPRVIRFDRRWMYGVAAGVALLLGALVVLRSGVEEGTGDAARVAVEVETPVRTEEALRTSPVVEKTESKEPAKAVESRAVAKATPRHREKIPTVEAARQPTVSPIGQGSENAPAAVEPIAPLTSADDRILAVTTPQDRRAEPVITTDAEPSSEKNTDDSRGILRRLPIEYERLVVLDDIRQTAADRIQSIRETRRKIRNTDVTVAVGRRDLFTLRF